MKYLDNKKVLHDKFEKGSDFLDSLVSYERTQRGFYTGTDINLHYYFHNLYLFRLEFVGYDAIKIDFRPRNLPNNVVIKSMDFLSVVKDIVNNSNFKNNRSFIQDTIIINKSNHQYLDLLNQAIDRLYDQTIKN